MTGRFNVLANLLERHTGRAPAIERDKWNIKIQKKDLMQHLLKLHFDTPIKNDESFVVTTHLHNQEDENALVRRG